MRVGVAILRKFAIAGLVSGGLLAQADPKAVIDAVVQKNRALPGFRQAVEGNLQSYEAGLSTHCKDVAVSWPAAHAHLVRYGTMLPDGQADGTQWEEKMPGRACGESRDYRVLVLLRDGRGQIQPLLPGDGWAGPLLEHDTMLQVVSVASAYTRQQCPVDVVNTHLTKGRPAENAKAPWTEVWTVHSCGKHFGVPITFMPDAVGDGTSMSVQPSKVVSLP